MVRHVTGGEPLPTLAERHRDRERGDTPGELRRHGLLYLLEGRDTRRANNEETGRGEDIGSAAEVLRGDTLGSNPPVPPGGGGRRLGCCGSARAGGLLQTGGGAEGKEMAWTVSVCLRHHTSVQGVLASRITCPSSMAVADPITPQQGVPLLIIISPINTCVVTREG